MSREPFYRDDWLTVFHGDCREVMAAMEPESVHCVVTSPPYWGLRDYGEPGQLGLERNPEEYVANLVAVFQEVRRVLRKDGTVWLNIGDSYVSQGGGASGGYDGGYLAERPNEAGTRLRNRSAGMSGLKPKDLVGIPWRVAFALQADGWYLRSEIIWSKLNPMPESVTDRPTKSHETIFLLSKSPRYYFDADAVREPHLPSSLARYELAPSSYATTHADVNVKGRRPANGVDHNPAGRNIRSVWTMATQPYPGAHFATFPESLPERCIKAGTSEKGVCPECGAPWERVATSHIEYSQAIHNGTKYGGVGQFGNMAANRHRDGHVPGRKVTETTGWQPSCTHTADPVPAVVLDPFAGSGTTGMVAQSLSRRAVLIDLSLDYLDQLMVRNADIPLGLTS